MNEVGTTQFLTIHYQYDATGNRVQKAIQQNQFISITHYVRDASGNILATYQNTKVQEFIIYGASRLGTYTPKTDDKNKLILGYRNYELTNHLGNVLAVISDKNAEIVSANDYYPFGMVIESRTYQTEEYRFSFNGQERDTEININIHHAEFWKYDARTARRWNTDPVFVPFDSPYATFRGNPIMMADPNGDVPLPLIAFGIGAVIDYGLQVGINVYNTEGSIIDNATNILWNDVNMWSVLVAGTGAAAGVPAIGTVNKFAKGLNLLKLEQVFVIAGLESLVDGANSALQQLLVTGQVNMKSVGSAMLFGQARSIVRETGKWLGKVFTDKAEAKIAEQMGKLKHRQNRGVKNQSAQDELQKPIEELKEKVAKLSGASGVTTGTSLNKTNSGHNKIQKEQQAQEKLRSALNKLDRLRSPKTFYLNREGTIVPLIAPNASSIPDKIESNIPSINKIEPNAPNEK